MTEKTFAACDDTLNDALAFVEEELEKLDCPMKINMMIAVSVEEVFVNIAHYAYGGETGRMHLAVMPEEGGVAIRFRDSGMPFDPLMRDDPDITLSAEERQIGGLGIYMVKKSMDDVIYSREDGENILTIKKRF